MQVEQCQLREGEDVAAVTAPLVGIKPQLVLLFGAVSLLDGGPGRSLLDSFAEGTVVVGCSTAGEITDQGVVDERLIATAITFEPGVELRAAEAKVARMEESQDAGRRIGEQLAGDDLKSLLIFGQGVDINGSALIEGVMEGVGQKVPITGGLAGDGGAFKRTLTVGPSGIRDDSVVAVGLYGSVRVGHGSFGGWSSFGPARKVTRSEGNVLYELDGEAALTIYRKYLGEYASDLPSSGLLFPFEMVDEDHRTAGLIRTILGIDEAQGSLILAGDIDPNGYLRLMHASTDALVDGAEEAARRLLATLPGGKATGGVALLVSCVGRKLVMGDQIDEEVEAVAAILGSAVAITGFYSYGEISPFSTTLDCKLHNQTMTITLISGE
jgi:hypothetical protein